MSTKEDIRQHLVCLLGGRAAELIVFGEVMAGAASGKESDIGRASMLAAIAEVEFDETVQYLHLAGAGFEMIGVHLSRDRFLRETVQERLADALQVAKQFLHSNRSLLEILLEQIQETGRVSGRELASAAAFICSGS